MRGAVLYAPGDVRLEERNDPTIVEPTDAVVRLSATCVCGSDLWPYRGLEAVEVPAPMGHEYVGVVEEVGNAVTTIKPGQFVIGSFFASDNTCEICRAGYQSSCIHRVLMGTIGTQAQYARVPLADGTLVKVPGSGYSDPMMASLLALSDVMGTGEHAAVCAGVKAGDSVAVVGDGAVGLCGVIAAKRHGADRIIALSRNPARQELARKFGATDIVEQRGDEATAAVMELTDGVGVDATLECVGTGQAMETALSIARPGSLVGYVGVPHGVELPVDQMFFRNTGVLGGPAPVRHYMPELLEDVLDGEIEPGRVFDFETDLDGVPEAYAAMDERRAIKSLLHVSAV